MLWGSVEDVDVEKSHSEKAHPSLKDPERDTRVKVVHVLGPLKSHEVSSRGIT